jgi:hypothetical protein
MKMVLRYFLTYLGLGILYALISFGLDLIFGYQVRHSGKEIVHYMLYFYLMYFIFVIPFVAVYNLWIDQSKKKPHFITQILVIGLFSLLFGFLLRRMGISFYIGELRPLKNIILCFMIAIVYASVNYFFVHRRANR